LDSPQNPATYVLVVPAEKTNPGFPPPSRASLVTAEQESNPPLIYV